MATSLQSNLSGLTTREAIQDTLYRMLSALDVSDWALFESAFTPDAVFHLDDRVMDGLDAIKSGCFDVVSKLDTTHMISNIRIANTETTASVTATAMSQHYKKGQGKTGGPYLLAGALYNIDMVKEDLWKVKLWKMNVQWAEGDWSVVAP